MTVYYSLGAGCLVVVGGLIDRHGPHDVLGSYQTALWCLVALEGIAAVSVLGGRALRDDP